MKKNDVPAFGFPRIVGKKNEYEAMVSDGTCKGCDLFKRLRLCKKAPCLGRRIGYPYQVIYRKMP